MNNILNNVVTDDEETEDIFGDDIVNIAAPIINAPIKAGNNIFNNIHDAVITEEDRNHDLYLQPRGDPNACIQNFYEEVIPAYTDQQFYEHFRMHRNVFEELVSIIEARIAILNANPENNSDNDSGIPMRKKILLTIWVLATPDSYRSIADRFGLGKSKAHTCFKEIVSILADLISEFVTWPNEDLLREIEQVFMERSQNRFPGIVGAIDGCHIQIKQPPHNAHDFYNRKETHSVILQGTCDHTGKFTDVLIGRPGRCHDASVLHSSALYRRLIDPVHPLLSNCQHLLGDSGYPLSTHILTPFRDNGHLSDQETRYNVVHASCRSIIERAFGLLKVKFRRLYHLDVQSVTMANVMIAASCTLHNFNLMRGQANIWDNINFVNENRDDDDHYDDDIGDDDSDGVIKRDRIMEAM
ncbi:unnamed protein product [Parnassius apollo]|uniref:(apollo) hypothetical protein n=1 Tax=Parnassius apollo TaxID=110799 RepID=A0A8S3XXC8_PARAO|nr:unnamed protein product [Parnassius apollo]